MPSVRRKMIEFCVADNGNSRAVCTCTVDYVAQRASPEYLELMTPMAVLGDEDLEDIITTGEIAMPSEAELEQWDALSIDAEDACRADSAR
jgi:hypothetical protein